MADMTAHSPSVPSTSEVSTSMHGQIELHSKAGGSPQRTQPTHVRMLSSDLEMDSKVQRSQKFIDFCGRFIPCTYLCFGVVISAMFVTGFVMGDDKVNEVTPDVQNQSVSEMAVQDVVFPGILVAVLLVSLLGAWAVYRFGVVQDQIDRLQEENNKYQQEIEELKITKEKFGKEVTKLQGTVQNLQHDANALDEEAKQFQGLVDELKNIAEDNEHIMELLDHTNQTFNDMRECVLENERAYLLTQYYKCAFRDDDNNMDEREYRRFLGTLAPEQRKRFEQLGKWKDISLDGQHIDLQRFQDLLEKVLLEVDDLLKEQFQKLENGG